MQTESTTVTGRGLLARVRQVGRRAPLSSAFVKFLIVGGMAYVIGLVALVLLYDALPILPVHDTHVSFGLFTEPDISLLIASVVAVELSIVFKFYALQSWAFPDRARKGHYLVRFVKFTGTCLVAQVITIAAVNVITPVFNTSPYVSTTIGTLAAFMVNWAFSTYVIWPHHGEGAAEPASG
jgi:putative flippase GtrA